jgi:hypothetical protein
MGAWADFSLVVTRKALLGYLGKIYCISTDPLGMP